MSDAYSVGFKDGAAAGYKLAIEDMKLDKKPQIMKKYEGDHASLLARHNALREAVEWERECEQLDFWGVAYALCRRYPGNYIDAVRADFYAIRDCARAEVDRLLENEP